MFYFIETNSSQIEKLCNIIFQGYVHVHFRVHKHVKYKLVYIIFATEILNTLHFSILCIENLHRITEMPTIVCYILKYDASVQFYCFLF